MTHKSRSAEGRRGHGTPADYAAVPRFVVAGFLVFVLFRYLQGGFRIAALGEMRFEAIVGGLLFLAALFLKFNQKRQPKAKSAHSPPASLLTPWVVALFLIMLLQVAFSVDPSLSWTTFVDRVFKFALFGFMIANFVTTPTVLILFLATYLLAFLKMTQEGILGYLTGSMIWENQGTPRLHGSTPSYFHPNSLAGTQLSTLPILTSLWGAGPKWSRYLLIAQGFGAVLVVLFTGSRTAYVAFIAWVAYLVYRSKSRLRSLMIAIAAAAVVVPLIPAEYYARFSTIVTQEDLEGSSIDLRKEIYTDAWQIFLEYPFGVGVGAFPVARQAEFGRSQDTHNLYLEVATNLGIPGVIAFVGLLIAIGRTLQRTSREAERDAQTLAIAMKSTTAPSPSLVELARTSALIKGASIALLGFLVVRLALGFFGHDLYEIYWWFLAGTSAALSRMQFVTSDRVAWAVSSLKPEAGHPEIQQKVSANQPFLPAGRSQFHSRRH